MGKRKGRAGIGDAIDAKPKKLSKGGSTVQNNAKGRISATEKKSPVEEPTSLKGTRQILSAQVRSKGKSLKKTKQGDTEHRADHDADLVEENESEEGLEEGYSEGKVNEGIPFRDEYDEDERNDVEGNGNDDLQEGGNGDSDADDEEDEDKDKDLDDDEDADEDDDEDDDEDENDEEDDDDDEESDEERGSASPDIVNVDFEFFDPKRIDYHGVKGLLTTYLDDAPLWHVADLANTIIGQPTVGTVIKTADDESPLGLISCLSLTRYQEKPWVRDLIKFLQNKGGALQPQLDALLKPKGGQRVGLIVSERLVNIPFELAGPLHDALFSELEWAQEDEPTPELRESFAFDHYLLLTKVYRDTRKQPVATAKEMKSKGKATDGGKEKGELVYIKPEDEVFHKLSSWSFTFPVKAEAQAARQTKGLRQFRLVLALPSGLVGQFRSRLKRLIEEGSS
eukprot:TRINITY_DN10063_c0_g2_i1.p1 TRINITY_DN10063_c0_g2~~TRINITY_DN10063_c0_g2_i1.p1  ORF type:complete len:453 (-),score=118.25 TRINITY_DN10063_c0_g2_i1:79-1437(-)